MSRSAIDCYIDKYLYFLHNPYSAFVELLELKKKFEEDKQRVALLKQQRKFKPF